MTMCSTVQWSAGDVRCARQIATLIIAIITDCDMCLFICCDCRRNNNNNNNDIYKQRSWAALSKIRRAAGTCHSVLTKRCAFRRRAKVAVDSVDRRSSAELLTSASARRIYDKRRGVQSKLCATPRPLFKGNISVANCMLLSSLLKTTKINGNEYPVDHCWMFTCDHQLDERLAYRT